ncbi:HD domain-containing protein [Ktedonosporobacter rubrisoli]|uniref:HD domain-containing protein n=1 Tax=Ktedonosporobacter rubrisoli TaxID=2509675 RepID=A0A4P6JM80_KTERU|nr:AAA family ATPase [Ktedonosporobacter rubrisoli]QBD76213.1 HD domain-containing protein [Ktedonosporobacter rubrisoli]
MQEEVACAWSFPYCPEPPHWQLDWAALQEQFSWLRALAGVPQDALYHAEGDVLIHTGMVASALVSLEAWRRLAPSARQELFAAALLHDVAKPQCTQLEADGHISSRGHARKGAYMARRLLWSGEELQAPLSFAAREHIARLVSFHGLPLHFLDKPDPARAVIRASMSARLDYVALLAEADVRGRICTDQAELLARIELFRDFCQEQNCFTGPYQFASEHSRFVYFHNEHIHPTYAAYDDTTFEVVLMAGLPGVGKDSWIARHLSDWPVISLDELRRSLHVAPEEPQGRVIQVAKEQARISMRQQRGFVWNATNVTAPLRSQLIDFFVSYGARVRIIYLDAPLSTILHRNRERAAYVPENVLNKLLNKLDVPDLTEAHTLQLISL